MKQLFDLHHLVLWFGVTGRDRATAHTLGKMRVAQMMHNSRLFIHFRVGLYCYFVSLNERKSEETHPFTYLYEY